MTFIMERRVPPEVLGRDVHGCRDVVAVRADQCPPSLCVVVAETLRVLPVKRDAQVMRAVLSNQDELNARIYRFPTSAIKQNDRKINYYDFLMATGNKDCNVAVMRMMPRFHLDEMQAFIREVPFLDELQRRFYQTYLSARMERIMIPVHRRIMEQQQRLSPRLHM